MTKPYVYEDAWLHELTITPTEGEVPVVSIRTDGLCVELPPEELPAVVAALYLATGQDVPLILPRPGIRVEEAAHEWVKGGRITAPCHDATYMTSAQARARAAAYAVVAELADTLEVDALAELLGGIPQGPDHVERVAQALVRAGWRREAAPDA
ncbi:hypothetical protein [Sphaerisporangium aureirubrum]|uniref:Uncharacterized protein n=1 Tax=Sphaerisporangium aureirubrum TaxID=1544736 RepID=A0ABW1ND46_9ACTN